AEEVELSINGRSQGRRPTGQENRYTAVFTVAYARGSIEAVAIRAGEPGERTALQSASSNRHLTITADRTRLRDDPDELAFLSIEVVDENGVRAVDADDEITLAVDGAGRQQGF